MSAVRKLDVPAGYDPARNPRISSFAAQLDDQLRRLKQNVADLEVRHLEWQPHAGMNSIGMLLAHLALVDIWWIRIGPRQVPEAEWGTVAMGIVGIDMDGDGMPAKPDALHPATLAGKPLSAYLEMIDAARAATHGELREWRDADLAGTYTFRDRVISREWTLYHVLEHFCGHYG